MTEHRPDGTRRRLLGAGVALATGALIAGLPARRANAAGCTPGHPMPAQTEGPYYTRATPPKANFRTDAKGAPVVLEGLVLDAQCRPLPGAWLDFWHADAEGAYDDSGFRLRGHQFADAAGRYRLETILPGLYPGRARHIHVKLRAREGARIFTTQVYFPGDPGNARDRLARPELVAQRSGASYRLDFVLPD